ncbi:MAG: thrombospondin type 3 repeat-containing protein [Myxococcota bacterium]
MLIAIAATPDSCYVEPGEVVEAATAVLTTAGHEVRVTSADDLLGDQPLGDFDVLLLGAGNSACDWDWSFDSLLGDFVEGGGGVVVTGWVLAYAEGNQRDETYPGLIEILPMEPSFDFVESQLVLPVPGHPITNGLQVFENPQFSSFGPLRSGATPLTREGDSVTSAAWTQGDGRVVSLGPTFLADFGTYENKPLLNGTIPDATRLLLRAVSWAGQDDDFDAVANLDDNCPDQENPSQQDWDEDGIGDVCDVCPIDPDNDPDDDGRCTDSDPCPFDPLDDADMDGLCGDVDNCPYIENIDQLDSDNDGIGDACTFSIASGDEDEESGGCQHGGGPWGPSWLLAGLALTWWRSRPRRSS